MSKKIARNEKSTIRVAEDLGVDPAEVRRASVVREVAFELARRLGHRVELVYAEELTGPRADPVFNISTVRAFVRAQRSRLEKLAKRYAGRARSRFEDGPPVAALTRLTRRRGGCELLVLGTHGRTGLNRVLLGSVAEEIVRRAEIPVLTVGARAQRSRARFLGGKERPTLLLATDLGPSSLPAERYAASLARRLNARLVLAHCLHESLHPVMQTAFSMSSRSREVDELIATETAKARQRLDRRCAALRRTGLEVVPAFDPSTGSAVASLLAAVKEHRVDAVVMGTHARGALLRAFLGSTARKLILESPVPVITVRSGG